MVSLQISYKCVVAYNMPTPNSSALQLKRGEEQHPRLVPYTKYMHVINSRYMYFSKMTSVETFEGLSRVDSFGQNKCYLSQWKLQWIESERIRFVFFFLKESVLLGMKKDFGHFRMNTSECGLSMGNATCPLHGFIKWVRHLWPSGDWEPVFACRESRSKQMISTGLCMLS